MKQMHILVEMLALMHINTWIKHSFNSRDKDNKGFHKFNKEKLCMEAVTG